MSDIQGVGVSSPLAMTAGAMAVALGAFGACATPAQAGVIVTQVNQDLAVSPIALINFEGSLQFAATYSPTPSPTLKVAPNTGNLVASSLVGSGGVIGPATTFQTTPKTFPPFPNTDVFEGLDIVSGPDNFYGWADFGGAGGTVLKAYAFETIANTPITASLPVPEPSPLTVLAIGAAALLAIRRRSAQPRA